MVGNNLTAILIAIVISSLSIIFALAENYNNNAGESSSGKKILFMMTNNAELGKSGLQTGNYLPEFAHPYKILNAHFTIVLASPKGGNVPIDPSSIKMYKDSDSIEFLSSCASMNLLQNKNLVLDQLNPTDFDAVFIPGGNGPMYDLPTNPTVQKFIREIYEADGIVGSVCHGTAGLVNVKLSNGEYLINGKRITGFSNTEEDVLKFTEHLPFLIKENGAIYSKANQIWRKRVLFDGKIVTGQNPASS